MKEDKLKLLGAKLTEFMPEMRRIAVAPKNIDCGVHLAPHQFFCLTIVKKLDSASMKDLSIKMGVSKQQLTRIIDSLENQKLLVRFNLPTNRRMVFVKLTKDGEELLYRHREVATNNTISRLAVLDEVDIDRLIEIVVDLAVIVSKLKPMEG